MLTYRVFSLSLKLLHVPAIYLSATLDRLLKMKINQWLYICILPFCISIKILFLALAFSSEMPLKCWNNSIELLLFGAVVSGSELSESSNTPQFLYGQSILPGTVGAQSCFWRNINKNKRWREMNVSSCVQNCSVKTQSRELKKVLSQKAFVWTQRLKVVMMKEGSGGERKDENKVTKARIHQSDLGANNLEFGWTQECVKVNQGSCFPGPVLMCFLVGVPELGEPQKDTSREWCNEHKPWAGRWMCQ